MNKSVQEFVKFRKEELKKKVDNKDVRLYIIQVGDNSASNSYIKGKLRDCEEVGITAEHRHTSEDITTESLVGLIKLLNGNKNCHGIIVQLPLPPHIDVKEVQLAIDPSKDVDGFHPMSHFKPCTPMGVINFLKYLDYNFEGKNALVIGRSDIVGKPLAELLTDLDCTVTLAHSKTVGIGRFMNQSDLIFTAINEIEFYDTSFGFPFAEYIIDIGLGVSPRDNKLHGNLSEDCVKALKKINTPVISGIGGVGLLTRLQLLENTIEASRL